MLIGVLVKGIVARLFRRIFGQRWRWRSEIVIDGNII